MSRKGKKNGNQDSTLKYIVLVTALLNLVKALIELINRLIE